jgi:hypothetical protein
MKRSRRRKVVYGLLLVVVLVLGLVFLGPRYLWGPGFDLEGVRQARSLTVGYFFIEEGGQITERRATISSPEDLRDILGEVEKVAEHELPADPIVHGPLKPSQLSDISGWLSYWFSPPNYEGELKIVLANGSVKDLRWGPGELHDYRDQISVVVSPSFEHRIATVLSRREGKPVRIITGISYAD